MAPGDIVQVLFVIILLMLSAFFSSAETALTMVSRVRMRTLAEDGNKKAQRVLDITDNKAKMLSAILIGNNVVNLSASSLLTALATNLFGSQWIALSTGVLTFLILIFGEISPKTFSTFKAEKDFPCLQWNHIRAHVDTYTCHFHCEQACDGLSASARRRFA